MGNTRSIANAMKEIDFNTELAYQAEKIHSFDKIILLALALRKPWKI